MDKEKQVMCIASGEANKGIITQEECLQCALANGSNTPCGFDYILLKYIYSKERYDEEKVHVSDILGCARQAYFSKKFTLPTQAHKSLIVTFGTIQHQLLEDMADKEFTAEQVLRNSGLVGTADVVYNDGRLLDYKCSLPTDRINMADGTEKTISDLEVGDRVLAYDELNSKFVASTVSSIFSGGVQEVFNIKLRDGNEINVSGNHPIMTQRGWVIAKELTTSDKVVEVFDWLPDNDALLSTDLSRFLGYLVGDGGLSRDYGVRFSSTDDEIISDLGTILESQGWYIRKVKGDNVDYAICDTDQTRKDNNRTSLSNFIIENGLRGSTSVNKEVPEAILKSGSSEVVANFIGGLFDTDGTVTDPDEHIPPRITFVTVSPVLARQVSSLLKRLGINNRIYKVMSPSSRALSDNPPYHICVWAKEDIVKFNSIIPIHVGYKKERLSAWCHNFTPKKTRKNKQDVISVSSLGYLDTEAIEVEKYHTYITSDIVTHNTTRNISKRYLPRKKHKLQVNVYAHMLRQEGQEVNSAAIQYMDFMGPSKCPVHKAFVVPGNKYPKCPICEREDPDFHLGALLTEVELLPDEEIEEFIEEKTTYLQNCLDNEEIPEPSPDFLCRYCPFISWCEEGQNTI